MNNILNKYDITTLKWDLQLEKRIKDRKRLEPHGFKVYSQSDEDGIIEEIFNRIKTTNKTFIEFGVDYGIESNSHYLLLKGWNGMWIEGSESNVSRINQLFRPAIDKKKLKVINRFIDRDNINDIIISANFKDEIDFLSIDIDGNDIYVWEKINVVNPRVVCIEYNGKIPPTCSWKQPYNPMFIWDGSDFTGSSLKAINEIGEKKGYKLVGTNNSGVNAFFVRKDLIKNRFVKAGNIMELYNPPRFDLVCQPIGHPPAVFIGMREESKYWYLNCADIQYAQGFSYVETLKDGREFAWTNAQNSSVLIYAEGRKEFRIRMLIQLDDTKVRIGVQDYDLVEYLLSSGEQTVDIKLDESKELNDPILIKINMTDMWTPDTEDTRLLGVGVFKKTEFPE